MLRKTLRVEGKVKGNVEGNFETMKIDYTCTAISEAGIKTSGTTETDLKHQTKQSKSFNQNSHRRSKPNDIKRERNTI